MDLLVNETSGEQLYISGSGNSGNSGDDEIYERPSILTAILLSLSPLIFVGSVVVCFFLCICISNLSDLMIKKWRSFLHFIKYCTEKKQQKLPINNNNNLTLEFIKKLNIRNKIDIQSTDQTCTICLEDIHYSTYKKNNIIFTDCKHVYHTACLQEWVKTSVSNISPAQCPICRAKLYDTHISIPSYVSDGSDGSDDGDWSDSYD